MEREERRPGRSPLLGPAGGLLAGVLLGDVGCPAWAWAAFGLTALGFTWFFLRRDRLTLAAVALVALCLPVGVLRQRQASLGYERAMAQAALPAGAVLTLRGEILDRMEERNPGSEAARRVRWRLEVSRPARGILTASFGGEAPGLPGEMAVMTGLYRPPQGSSNPGGYDGVAWALHEGLLGSLSVGGPEGVSSLGVAPGPMAALRRLRERLRGRLERIFPEEAGALLGALLLGVREPLDPGLSDAFLETGTVHYLSISGAHVLLVLGALAWLLAWTPLGMGFRAALLIAAALLYAGVVGLQAPVLRASLAASLAGAALLLGRPRAVLNALAAAAILIVLWDPGQAFRVGFQLSFLAAAGILLLASPLGLRLEVLAPVPRVPWASWLRRYLLGALAVSLAAWMAVLPLVARQFHLFTPVVLPANPVVFPLVAGVMAAGGLSLLFPPLAPLAKFLIAALTGTVEACARLPGGHAYLAEAPAWWIAAYYGWMAWMVWRLRSGGPAPLPRLASIGLALLAAALCWAARPTAPSGSRVSMLDVGQGLCVVAQMEDGRTLLYDCGAYGHPEAGGRSMAPALWALGVKRIDTLAISHAHDDHFNGLPALARRFPIGCILSTRAALAAPSWASAEAMRGDIPLTFAAAGDRLDLGGEAFAEVLHPAEAHRSSPNDASLCLRLSLPARRATAGGWRSGTVREVVLREGRVNILLTGDLEGLGTAFLLASSRDPGAQILLVPHHGGALGPLDPLLKSVCPEEAWVSAREGFPSPGTLAGISSSGAALRETWREGAVILEAEP